MWESGFSVVLRILRGSFEGKLIHHVNISSTYTKKYYHPIFPVDDNF